MDHRKIIKIKIRKHFELTENESRTQQNVGVAAKAVA